MLRHSRLILFLFVTMWPTAWAHSASSTGHIRVALFRNIPTMILHAKTLRCGIPPLAPQAPEDPTIATQATIGATAAGITVNAQFFLSDQIACEAVDGPLTINDMPGYGRVHIYRTTQPGSTTQEMTVVDEMPIETYLLGVVGGEMQASWPAEALKAQAVIARSYVLAKLPDTDAHAAYDVDASVEDQVYRPSKQPAPSILAAVQSTAGEIVQHRDQILKTYFHSCCGGQTIPAEAVWGPDAAQGLSGVRDPYCLRSPHRQWQHHVKRNDLQNRLDSSGYITPNVRGLRIPHGNARASAITIVTDGDPLELAANTFRRTVGFQQLKSTWFTARPYNGGWLFRGRGYGHGVGLCQWGAKTMAERGKTYPEILKFYYPGTTLKKLY